MLDSLFLVVVFILFLDATLELNSREGKVFLEAKFCGANFPCPTKTLLAHFPFYSHPLSDKVQQGVVLSVFVLFHSLVFSLLKQAPLLSLFFCLAVQERKCSIVVLSVCRLGLSILYRVFRCAFSFVFVYFSE